MKKKILTMYLLTMFSVNTSASPYVVIVDSESNSYDVGEAFSVVVEVGEWEYTGLSYNCSSLPLSTDYYQGIKFEQTINCDQKQERTISTYNKMLTSGEEILISEIIEETTVKTTEKKEEIGVYLATSCKDIVDHNGKGADGNYNTTSGLIYCDMDYKDGTGYNRTHLYKPNQVLLGGCTSWTDTRAEFCSGYTDTLSFNLTKENNAYVEYITYNYSGVPANGNTSIISVSDIDLPYNLLSPATHVADLSHNTNGSKTMVIRFTHDATSQGKDNNMGVKSIFLYEQ